MSIAWPAQPGEVEFQEDLINAHKYPKGGHREDRARLCSVVPGARTRDNRHKGKQNPQTGSAHDATGSAMAARSPLHPLL